MEVTTAIEQQQVARQASRAAKSMDAEAAAVGEGQVRHWTADVNGISLHVAERGAADAPAVLLIHGFPELWLSWRHQMAALAARGFRALAPDLRGYGDSSVPTDPAAYSILHIVGDLVALLDHLQLTKVPPFFFPGRALV
jgi:pimeloyl-ACP methyl ester carboxylesterase